MRPHQSWRARLAAAATVSALIAGGLIAAGGTPATAVTQNGANNYAGPKPCPRPGFDSCVNPTAGQQIVQGTTTGASNNVYEASGVGETVTQNTASGSNTATCSLQTTASTSQTCLIIQHNGSGPNLIMLAQSATLATGSTALTNVSQNSSQKLNALQTNNSGSNTIKGPGSTPEATQAISQTATTIVNVPVTHTQQTNQLVNVSQINSDGANSANFKLDRTQQSNATGATASSAPAVTQKQDTGPLAAPAETVCEGEQPANGSVCVYQRADGASGSNFLKVRASDTKDENAKTLRSGPTSQTQGPTPPALGGWLVRPHVANPDPGQSTVDIGVQNGTAGGIVKNWSMEAAGAVGGQAVPGSRHQYDGIRLPIIGLSPDTVTSFEKSTLTAPNGTQQIANVDAVGHADTSWVGRVAASLTSDTNVAKTVDFSGQNINASLDCTQNSPTTCQSLPTSSRNIETSEGSPFSGIVAGFTGTADNVPGDFSATIDWGDGTQSNGTVQNGDAAGQFVVTGAHTYSDECTCPVNVSIASADQQFQGIAHSTAFVADAPLSANGRGLSTPSLGFGGVVANFTDANPGNHLSDFTATINWGDGSSSPGSITGPNGSGVYDVTGSHTYASSGTYNVVTTIRDVGGSTATANSVLATSSASAGGLNFTATEYTPYSGPVATFSDANTADTPSDFTATINWGDGSTSAGSISGGNGSFIVSGTHTYNEQGTYTVQTTVRNVHNSAIASTATSHATVNDAAFTLTGRSLSQSSKSFSGVVATGTDYESGISATINWGDGSTSSVSGGSGITADGHGGFTVSASHTYATTGTKTITITARDTEGETASATTTLHIGTT